MAKILTQNNAFFAFDKSKICNLLNNLYGSIKEVLGKKAI